jgi:hypothetical protein
MSAPFNIQSTQKPDESKLINQEPSRGGRRMLPVLGEETRAEVDTTEEIME